LATSGIAQIRDALAQDPPPIGATEGRVAAVALIFSPTPVGLSVCMIRRAEHPKDPWSGQMAFPGGRREPKDADSLATAIRETEEEIGIVLRREQCLGALSPVFVPLSLGTGPMTIEAFVFAQNKPICPQPNQEVAGVYQFPLAQLVDATGRGSFDYLHKDIPMKLECIDLQGCRIWGLSLRMIDHLLGRLAAVK
jgi:8-oxo-dGTP pyrophosphatase MutT (NUDIX family)